MKRWKKQPSIEIDLDKGTIKGRTIAKHWKEHIEELMRCYE